MEQEFIESMAADLEIGQVYTVKDNVSCDGNVEYIVRILNNQRTDNPDGKDPWRVVGNFIRKSTDSYKPLSGLLLGTENRKLRKATIEEIVWLSVCEKSKKYIPLNKALEDDWSILDKEEDFSCLNDL
jgi:hypothetical protein